MKKVKCQLGVEGGVKHGVPIPIFGVAELVEDHSGYSSEAYHDPPTYAEDPNFWYLSEKEAQDKWDQLTRDKAGRYNLGFVVVPGEGILLSDGTIRVLGEGFVQETDEQERKDEAEEKLRSSGLTVTDLELLGWKRT